MLSTVANRPAATQIWLAMSPEDCLKFNRGQGAPAVPPQEVVKKLHRWRPMRCRERSASSHPKSLLFTRALAAPPIGRLAHSAPAVTGRRGPPRIDRPEAATTTAMRMRGVKSDRGRYRLGGVRASRCHTGCGRQARWPLAAPRRQYRADGAGPGGGRKLFSAITAPAATKSVRFLAWSHRRGAFRIRRLPPMLDPAVAATGLAATDPNAGGRLSGPHDGGTGIVRSGQRASQGGWRYRAHSVTADIRAGPPPS